MSSYINPAPQGDPKATGAYAVGIAAQTGAEGRDSAGNLAVDYVWGSRPLLPDTERLESIADVTANVYGAVYDVPSGGNQAFNVSNISGIAIGDSFDITGASPYALNTSYVVETIYPSSPTGGVLVTTTPNGINGDWLPTVMPILTKSTSDNVGGGAGDKSWSKTTKKKSVKLDPALDGHNIATEYWNNFPNYTPNAGFIPQELWSYNLVPNGSLTVQIGPDWQESWSNSYPSGYIISLTPNVVTDSAKYAELVDYVASDAVIGKSTDAFVYNFNDDYGSNRTVNIPAGTIVGSDTEPNMYGGGTLITLTVHTGTISTDGPMVWTNSRGQQYPFNFVIGAGVNKTLIYKGVVGTDFRQTIEVTDNSYGDVNPYITIQPFEGGPALSAATLDLVNVDLTGAIAGYGNIAGFDMQGYNVKKVTFPMSDANFYYTTDMYGGSVTNVRLTGTEPTVMMGGTVWEYTTGTVLYIVK